MKLLILELLCDAFNATAECAENLADWATDRYINLFFKVVKERRKRGLL